MRKIGGNNICHKIGEIFEYQGHYLKVAKMPRCGDCIFNRRDIKFEGFKNCGMLQLTSEPGPCGYQHRDDQTDVSFIEVSKEEFDAQETARTIINNETKFWE